MFNISLFKIQSSRFNTFAVFNLFLAEKSRTRCVAGRLCRVAGRAALERQRLGVHGRDYYPRSDLKYPVFFGQIF